MARISSNGSSEYRPLSPWAYFGWALLFNIPLIGFVIAVVVAFDHSNINRRNYARSFFIIYLVYLILWLILSFTNWNMTWLNWIFF
jgi:hypothetical protein